MSADATNRNDNRVLGLSLFVAAVLTLIGLRFLFWPEAAARMFGVPGRPTGYELHYAIALRDLWLGLLAIALALSKEWRALALWMALGVLVCLGDAAIAMQAGSRWPAISFHAGSGVLLASLATALLWRR
jgi:hypothetical protein